MNDMTGLAVGQPTEPETAIAFEGSWREFLPIAVTNLLLTIATLGIYRFWAKARERRYLWSRTRFIDDTLEWTGTGKEMFIGFLLVFLILIPAVLIIQFVVEALLLRGQAGAAFLLGLALYSGFFYLIGVAGFRALRYRLSRTYWHGIRGGSADGGWAYGGSYIWKYAVAFLLGGLLTPWAMTSLWNDRWNRMSFGPHQFEAYADTDGLFGRWMLVYLVPVVGMIVLIAAAGTLGGAEPSAGGIVALALIPLGLYLAFFLVGLVYYAAFYRKVVASTTVAGLNFEFNARTVDWLKLILGNVALVVFTLGAGLMFISYRNWSFMVRHAEATGQIDLDALSQSRLAAPSDAEGLADAFDIGGI